MNDSGFKAGKGIMLLAGTFLVSSLFGQSSKQIKEMGIKSQTILEVFIEEGIDQPVIEKKETYDEQGQITEVIEYNKTGEITNWQKFEYDQDGNITGEMQLDNKGRTVSRIRTIYENQLKTEKQYFDSKDRMFKKKIYKYEYLPQPDLENIESTRKELPPPEYPGGN
jgi:hypothetical protein